MLISPGIQDWITAARIYRRFVSRSGADQIASRTSLAHLTALLRTFECKRVLELGVGIGTITYLLLQKQREVVALEHNSFCQHQLELNIPPNLRSQLRLVSDGAEIDGVFDLVIIDGKISACNTSIPDAGNNLLCRRELASHDCEIPEQGPICRPPLRDGEAAPPRHAPCQDAGAERQSVQEEDLPDWSGREFGGQCGLTSRMGIDQSRRLRALPDGQRATAVVDVILRQVLSDWLRYQRRSICALRIQEFPQVQCWMGGRVVEGTGLENRQARKRLEGSNPSPSASNIV